ncbi:MAG: hypothetical protein WCA97_12405 [Terriglobales bacterium]
MSVLIVTAMPFAVSHAAVSRSDISNQRIADAMGFAGIVAGPDQIEILSSLDNISPSATMRVVSVSKGTAGTVKAKLRCRDNRECLPFYVLVHGFDGLTGSELAMRPAPAVTTSTIENVVRDGDHAMLIVETKDSRMSFPVICLHSGGRGQRIRVTSLDRKRFYDAEVVAAGILKGTL